LLATEALLSSTRLQRSRFALLAVIGQQLLDIGHSSESVRVLEAALKLPHAGPDHQRVVACLLSTLAAGCWALDRIQASIVYSLRALAVASSLRNSSSPLSSSSSLSSCSVVTDIHHHHHHQFILQTQNKAMSENTEKQYVNNKNICSKGQKGRDGTYNCPHNIK